MKPLRSPQCDPQREAYYEAEQQFHPGRRYLPSMPMRMARKVAADVRKLYALPPVRLVTVAAPSRSVIGGYLETDTTYEDEVFRARIVLHRGCADWTLYFLLHELAHLVVGIAWPDAEDHGREFAGVARWLYNKYRIIPQDALSVIYRRYGIKAIPFTSAAPPAVRLLTLRNSSR